MTQHGFVTAGQAAGLNISKQAVQMLVHRGTLERHAHGVYRFPKFPSSEYDRYMRAALWARLPEAAISHEAALDVYGVTSTSPHHIHLTIDPGRRVRRSGGDDYVLHREWLPDGQRTRHKEIPVVRLRTAILQCLDADTSTYRLRQAISRGQILGHLTDVEHAELLTTLDERREF
ncbi:MAG: type IV toxin-antitoxin system AbiEi family antitoxin domain-containing protein [Aeromicrobium sp.]|uniref:type IV toxin-antitoxin system AbiEi family antitoxin domain-containing protein n=1 Tax=Aeromicrobium sp. TaxID=1871063 RepID=UPI0039E6859C